MTSSASAQSMSIVPVEVSGQIFGIPLADLQAVFASDKDNGNATDTLSTNPPPDNSIPLLGLPNLFWGAVSQSSDSVIIVISTRYGICAVQVDAVFPVQRVEIADVLPLPSLIGALARRLFIGAVWQLDHLVLILGGEALSELLQQAASELVSEHVNIT